MGIIIGIDVGGSTTKIVGFKDQDTIYTPLFVKANDQITSLFGAFGKFTSENNIAIKDIEKVMVTGVGATFVKSAIYGVPTGRADEFLCTGLGGLYLSGLSNAVVVSMGTGTAFVSATWEGVKHLGGTGVGGGTLLGLSSKMLGINKVDNILTLASSGDLSKVDLSISDITNFDLPMLPSHVTASNFGKMSELANNSDIAMGILNMIFQTIGMLAIFASRIEDDSKVVLTGNLSTVSQAEGILDFMSRRYNAKFIKPQNSEFATAFGAALVYMKNKEYFEV